MRALLDACGPSWIRTGPLGYIRALLDLYAPSWIRVRPLGSVRSRLEFLNKRLKLELAIVAIVW
jgi:hypothetical protein